MNLTEMRTRRNEAAMEMKALVDGNPSDKWTPALNAKFDALEREIKSLDVQLDQYQTVLNQTAERLHSGDSPSTASVGLYSGDRASIAAAVGAYALRGDSSGINASMTEGGNGSILVPHEIASEVVAVSKKFSPIRSIAKVVSITTAASQYIQPVITDGATTGWAGETDERTTTDAPTIEGVTFPDAEMFANVPLTVWMDEDTKAGNLIIQELGKAFGRTEGAAFLAGTGTKQPIGLLHTAPTADVDSTRAFGTLRFLTSGSASTITADSLVNVVYDLLPEYRSNACWVLNSATIALIRKLKDSEGRYLWSDSLAPNDPAMLLGYKVVEANNMPDVAADAIPVLFGDFQSGYCIVDRSMTLLRDPYSDKRYVQFYSRKRVSANIIDSCAIRCLKIAA